MEEGKIAKGEIEKGMKRAGRRTRKILRGKKGKQCGMKIGRKINGNEIRASERRDRLRRKRRGKKGKKGA